MYLDGKVDLRTLTEKDDSLSEEELYDRFLRDMVNHETQYKVEGRKMNVGGISTNYSAAYDTEKAV